MESYCRNRVWLAFFYAGLILVAGCAAPIERSTGGGLFGPGPCRTGGSIGAANPVRNKPADTSSLNPAAISNGANQSQSPPEKWLWLESAKADLATLPDRFIEDSKDTFLRADNMTALLLAGGASVIMHNDGADKNIAEHFARHKTFNGFADESLYTIGNLPTHFAAAGLWYAISAENQDEINKQRALTMITALSVTGVVTTGLKAIRDNETPNDRSWAWPSGHTSSSFTVASVLDEFYGPKVGIPAYILASCVAYRMMDTGDHWGSDIVFGATLGWVVGHTIAGKHKNLEIAGFELMPYAVAPTSRSAASGISLVKRF
jgi:hypothetical protein